MNLASTILKYDRMCASMTPARERYSVYFLDVEAELAPGKLCQVPLPLPVATLNTLPLTIVNLYVDRYAVYKYLVFTR